MTNPFDADDLFKRSILSSILGFSRKAKSTGRRNDCQQGNIRGTVGSMKNEDSSCPIDGIVIFNDPAPRQRKYRTKQEIYEEIVCECAELENNKKRSVACSTSDFTDMSTGPPSPDPNLSTDHNTKATIENLVRLMVSAVRESGILNEQGDDANSPQDILKRKRMQNNEAAARYRKRQKELREEADMELAILMNKNNELKKEIKRMQVEIEQLKARVLKRTTGNKP